LILLCQWHHTAVHEGGVTIADGSDGWVFTKPGSVTRTWPGISTSRYANSNRRSMFGWLAWTASSIPTPSLSDPAGPVNPSTYTPRQALFTIKLPEQATVELDQQAA
jgi:hypothetical protein